MSPQGVIDALDTGNFGVFHHVGHGFYFNMSVGPGAIVPADADGLTNGPNYFLLYSLNCSSSAFDFNCLNERFVRNPQGGAMASLGSSRAAFPSAAKPLQEEFYNTWLCGGRRPCGGRLRPLPAAVPHQHPLQHRAALDADGLHAPR